MAFNADIPFSELTWQNDADSREQADYSREERDLQDWEIAAPLAYYFARQRYTGDAYRVPEFLAYVTDARRRRHSVRGVAA